MRPRLLLVEAGTVYVLARCPVCRSIVRARESETWAKCRPCGNHVPLPVEANEE